MSFSSLPEELIENIARFVDATPRWDAKDNFKHILSLSLVSTQTLASSRRVLYREPFDRWAYQDEPSNVTWDRASSLLEFLEANDNQLGKLVRKTSGIWSWMYELDKASNSTTSTSGGLLSWYHRVLRACTRLQQVDLNFSTEDQLYTALRELSISLPVPHSLDSSSPRVPPASTLRQIRFGRSLVRSWNTPQVSCFKIFSALECSSIPSLDSVNIFDPDWLLEEDSSTICSFPLSIRQLKITSSSDRFAPWLLLFIQSRDTLEHVDLDGKMAIDGSDFAALSQTLGTNLRTLSLTLDSRWELHRTLSTYVSDRDTPSLIPEAFASFPHLNYLKLSCTHGPSLRLLETLAISSPLLSDLQLSYSRWISSQNPVSTAPDDIFPESEIITVLCKFTSLIRVNLGILPTLDRSRYQEFEDRLSKKDIWALYEICEKE